MDSGELCVMTHLGVLMLTLYADNWDTVELQHLVWTRASEHGFVLPVLYKLDDVLCSSSSYSCLQSCQRCPSSQ